MSKRLASGFDDPTFRASFVFCCRWTRVCPEIASRNESSRNYYRNGKIVTNKDDYSTMQYSTRVKSELIKIGGKYLFDIANDLLQLGREILFIFYFFKNIKKKRYLEISVKKINFLFFLRYWKFWRIWEDGARPFSHKWINYADGRRLCSLIQALNVRGRKERL